MGLLDKGIGENHRRLYPWMLAIIGGAVVLSFIWSAFYPYLMEFYGVADKAPFALGASALGFGNMLIAPPIAGIILDRWGPKATLALSSLCLIIGAFCMNHMLSISVWTDASTWWYIGSFIFGFASGCFAATHVSTSSKWNPDKLGYASGIANIGPAIGAFWMAPVAAILIPKLGIGGTFSAFAAIGVVVAILFGIIPLRLPEPGWKPAGWEVPQKEAFGVTFNEAIRTNKYWILIGCTFIVCLAGFLFAMNIATLIIEGCATIGGMDPKVVVATVVTMAISATAIVNALARPAWGVVLDKLGDCWKVLLILYIGFAISLLLFRFMYTGAVTAVIGACIVYAFFGGTAVAHMGATSTLFGTKSLGKILGSTQVATGVAWVIGPYLGAKLADITGSYATALYTATGCCIVGVILVLIMMNMIKKNAATSA